MSEVGLCKDKLDTPALWADLACVERNIVAMAATFRRAGIQWRPHTKGIKTPAIAHKLLAAGAIGVTCAKLGEAEIMAAAGIRDILVANEITTASKITRLAYLQRQADVKVAVDDRDAVAAIGAAAVDAGVQVGVLIEVDTGMQRAGVQPGDPVVALARHAQATPGVRLRGLMTWEGHSLLLTDRDEKRREIERSIGLVSASAEACRANGLSIDIVSAGGSGTYTVTPFLPGVTEIQAGGGIFCDRSYQSWGVELEPALFVRSAVTSRPTPDRIICDAGFKTMPRGFVPPLPLDVGPVREMALSAEHGIITLDAPNSTLKVGHTFDIMVGYGDATVFLHDQLYGVRDGVVEAVWPVLGRGKLR